MKLSTKVLLILSCAWLAISLTIFAYSRYSLTHDYEKLEQKEIATDIDRTLKTLKSIMSSLKLLNNDWAQWDDAYNFMGNKNKDFITSNLANTTFENAKINLILFFDTNGKLFYGQDYDLTDKKFVPIPKNLLKRIEEEKSLIHHENEQSVKTGILQVQDYYVVLSSLPILTSKGAGPIRGTLIMGYVINDRHIEELSEIVKVQVHLYPLPLPQHHEQLENAYKILKTGVSNYIAPQNRDFIFGYSFINNIENHPIGILQIQVPRLLYNEGIHTIDRYLAIIIGVGIIFLMLTWVILKKFVLDRIVSVSDQVINIKSGSTFEKRIHITGNDELGNMVSALNSLMEIIELTQNQLKYRIILRTEELEHLSTLNKNLHNEMSHQKEIEEQLREGEKVLRHMAYYDALTGLPNRFYFNEILQKIIAKSLRDGTGIAVLYLDADKFKSINDTHGHDYGDRFLKYSAHQLKSCLKETDIAARVAGDEFIVCLTKIKGKAIIDKVVNKILENMSNSLELNGKKIQSTFSIGISIYPEDGASVEELESHADLAMYYAKKKTGNMYCYYDDLKQGENQKTPQ